jgi:hypothetical protein
MPTTYTHDLFGKKIYRVLPAEMKRVIREHGDLYRIGLHGPDIFFYFMVCKNPVTRYGVKMHNECAAGFFEQSMALARETKDEALLAYLLGFGCHYLLDSVCHPYVDEVDAQGKISHALLEIEFDRVLMEREGKDPFRFYPSDAIVPKYSYARVIHEANPAISAVNTWISLHMMKWITNTLVCSDNGKKRKVLGKLASYFGEGSRRFIEDHFMRREPAAKCQKALGELDGLYQKAIAETPEYLKELYGLFKASAPLSERWNRTYNG